MTQPFPSLPYLKALYIAWLMAACCVEEPQELEMTSTPFLHAQLMPSALLMRLLVVPCKELLMETSFASGATPATCMQSLHNVWHDHHTICLGRCWFPCHNSSLRHFLRDQYGPCQFPDPTRLSWYFVRWHNSMRRTLKYPYPRSWNYTAPIDFRPTGHRNNTGHLKRNPRRMMRTAPSHTIHLPPPGMFFPCWVLWKEYTTVAWICPVP